MKREPLSIGLQREFFIDNLLVRIHLIIVMIRWTGLAPWEFESPSDPCLCPTLILSDHFALGLLLFWSLTFTLCSCTRGSRQLGEVSRGEKMLLFGTDPESYITEYTLVYEDSSNHTSQFCLSSSDYI